MHTWRRICLVILLKGPNICEKEVKSALGENGYECQLPGFPRVDIPLRTHREL